MSHVLEAGQSSIGKQTYVPGVCNIGPAEQAKRRQSGVVASVVTIVLYAALVAIGAPRAWRLMLILPAFAAASGFLQDALHFCAGFGMKGLYNVVNSAGITTKVASEAFHRKDLAKARAIIGLSVLIGAAIAGLSLV